MDGVFRRPQTEPVVVFGGQDHRFHAGVFQHLHPLPRIQTRRVEQGGVGRSGSPFLDGKRIHSKMNKCGQFLSLPGELAGSRHDGGRFPDDVGLAVRPVDDHILRCETVLCLRPGWWRTEQCGRAEARRRYDYPARHTPKSVHHFTLVSSLNLHVGPAAPLRRAGWKSSKRFRYARGHLTARV